MPSPDAHPHGHAWLFEEYAPPPADRDLLRLLRHELLTSYAELKTREAREKLLGGGSRTVDAIGASARAVYAIGNRVEELLGLTDGE